MTDREPFILHGNVYAWREWGLVLPHRGLFSRSKIEALRLKSAFRGTNHDGIWNDTVFAAQCTAEYGHACAPEALPSRFCQCGIYSYATLQDLMRNRLGVVAVIGMVRIFGNIQFYQYGSRAAFAKPELIIIRPDGANLGRHKRLAEALGEFYQCRAFYQNSVTFYEEQCALPEAERYPAIMPPLDLSGMDIPRTESDVEALNWKEVADHVKSRPTFGPRDRHPGH